MLYQEKEFKAGNNYYSVGAAVVGKRYHSWMVPCRILGLTPAEYAKLLIEEFNANVVYYPEQKFLSRYWISANDVNRWRLYINREARQKNYQV